MQANLNAPVIDTGSDINAAEFGDKHLLTEENGWEPPPGELIDAWFTQFKRAYPEYNSGKKLDYLLGMVGSNTDRRIRTFRTGERTISYGIWRRFLVITGRVSQVIFEVKGFFSD